MGNHYEVDIDSARRHPEYPLVHAYTTRMIHEHDAGTKATMEFAGIPYEPPAISAIRDQMIDGATAYAVTNFESEEVLDAQQLVMTGLQAVPDDTFYGLFETMGVDHIDPSAARMLIQAQTDTTLRQFNSSVLSASTKPIKQRIAGAHLVADELGITPVDVFIEEDGYRAFVRSQTSPTEVILQQLALREVMQPENMIELGQSMERNAAIIIGKIGADDLRELEEIQAEERDDPNYLAMHASLAQSLVVGLTVYTITELERFWGPEVVNIVPKELKKELMKPVEPQLANTKQTIEIGGMQVSSVTEESADFLRMREAFVKQYFEHNGWDLDDPTIEQIIEVRSQPGWKHPL